MLHAHALALIRLSIKRAAHFNKRKQPKLTFFKNQYFWFKMLIDKSKPMAENVYIEIV